MTYIFFSCTFDLAVICSLEFTSHYMKEILYVNTNFKGNEIETKKIYTFSIVSDTNVKKSCIFNVELKFSTNKF